MESTEKLYELAEFLNFKKLGQNSLCCAAMDELDDETIRMFLKSYNGYSFMDAHNAEDIIKQYADADVTGEKEYVSDFVKVVTAEYDFRRYTILKVMVEDQERVFIITAFPDDLAAIMVLQNQMIFSKKTIDYAIDCLKNQPPAVNKILYVGN